MTIMVKPHIIRFSPGYGRSDDRASAAQSGGQHQDVVQIGAVSGGASSYVWCHSCGEDIHTDLALVHRGRNLRGDTFEKAYHAWHVLGGGSPHTTEVAA